MRQPNIENLDCVKASGSRQELIDFHNSLLVEPYRENNWYKVFKKGSELEWFNPSNNLKEDNYFWGGVYRFPEEATLEQIKQLAFRK